MNEEVTNEQKNGSERCFPMQKAVEENWGHQLFFR